MPSANTLVRWVNENAFASIVQARPYPTFGRPVHLRGGPHRLQPGTSPHALRIPPHGGHPALRVLLSRPARHYSRFWIWQPSSDCQRDFNPPELRAAQRTLCPLLTSARWSERLSPPSVRLSPDTLQISQGKAQNFPCVDARFIKHTPIAEGGLRCHVPTRPGCTTPHIWFLFVAPQFWIGLPSDPTSR